jgi:hypothetical protein
MIHFSAGWREEAAVHNARAALIAGLAHGMQRPLLMLAEEDYASPIDYRDLLFIGSNVKRVSLQVQEWLADLLTPVLKAMQASQALAPVLDLGTELKSLRLGEDIAENEVEELETYFMETGSFLQVLQRTTTVFLGRKGTGKTANLLRAAAVLRRDKRNLVCVIKPYNYELEAVVGLLGRFQESDLRGYLIEGLWQYLLFSEIAREAAVEFRARPAGVMAGTPEWNLIKFVDERADLFDDAFSVRLERAILRLSEVGPGSYDVGASRTMLDDHLHASLLRELRVLLGRALADRQRVAVLVDNLDKAWDRSADLDKLSLLLLGLLSSIGRIAGEFSKKDKWREPVAVTLAVFLRSDIFNRVVRHAREPDKIPVTRVEWREPSMLLRLLETRYAAGRDSAEPGELWARFFPEPVGGVPAPQYMTSRVLTRPRDIVHFANEAIVAALNAGHSVVTSADIHAAELLYSQFALEALLVENGLSVRKLEEVLFEFAGSSAILPLDEVERLVKLAGIDRANVGDVVVHLQSLSFLGVEIQEDDFAFAEDWADIRKLDPMVRRFEETAARRARVQIHPAFRAYLEIRE